MPRFNIPFIIDGEAQSITAVGNTKIRAGSKNYWYAIFTFSDNIFNGLEYLTASFYQEKLQDKAKKVPLVSTGALNSYECQIPWEVMTTEGKVYVGVFAGDMLVTDGAEIEILEAVPVNGTNSDPSPSWYSQFEEELSKKQDKLTAGDYISIDENNVISAEIENITVDEELSLESENPVQNKVITQVLSSKIEFNDPVTNILFELQDETTATVTGYTFDQLSAAVQQQGRVDVYLAGDTADPSSWTRIIPIYISSDTMYFTTPTLFVELSIPALIFCRVGKTQDDSAEITYSVTQLQRLVALDSTPTFGSDVPVESNGIYLALQDKYEKPEGGIPKTDLANGVQSSLDKADTALQNHQSLAAYRTAAAQDLIDGAQDTAIAAKQDVWMYSSVTIAVTDWEASGNSYAAVKTVTGITTGSLVFVKYSDTETAFTEDVTDADEMTFGVAALPSAAITVDVSWFIESTR